MRNGFLYLFTSNYGQYYQDILNVLALPQGLEYRFRYDLKWIDSKIKTSSVEKNQSIHMRQILVGLHGLIIFRDMNNPHTLVPIRFVQVREVSVFEGSFLFLRFELMHFVKPDLVSNANGSEFLLNESAKNSLSQDKFLQYLENQDWGEFITQNSNSLSPHQSWKQLVAVLSTFEKLNQSVFVRVLDLRPVISNKRLIYSVVYQVLLSPNARIYIEQFIKRVVKLLRIIFLIPVFRMLFYTSSRYRLKSGYTYAVDFVHESPNNSDTEKQFPANLSFPEDHVSAVYVEQVIRGRYDLNSLIFHVRRKSTNFPGVIILNASHNDPDVSFPRLEVPVLILRNWTRTQFTILVFALVLFIGAVTDLLFEITTLTVIVVLGASLLGLMQVFPGD